MDLSRSAILLGEEGVNRLRDATVWIFGVGGVGSYAAEAIGRSGIGTIVLVDFDTVSPSNVNRQIPATQKTIGQKKVDVMAARLKDINPAAQITAIDLFCTPENIRTIFPEKVDFVIDAVDTVSAKLALAEICTARQIPLISCMGAGNKLDATRFVVTDIFKTTVCPLCRVMRQELRKREIKKLTVVYSTEEPHKTDRKTIGSVSYVPATAGLLAAGHVIRNIAEGK